MMSKKDRTRQQMEEEMRQLRKVFMTVRLMKALCPVAAQPSV